MEFAGCCLQLCGTGAEAAPGRTPENKSQAAHGHSGIWGGWAGRQKCEDEEALLVDADCVLQRQARKSESKCSIQNTQSPSPEETSGVKWAEVRVIALGGERTESGFVCFRSRLAGKVLILRSEHISFGSAAPCNHKDSPYGLYKMKGGRCRTNPSFASAV